MPEKVRRGEFRQDLYYRLKVVEIILPPLKERREDIPLLVDHFRTGFNKRFNKAIEAVSSDVMKAFIEYVWPGNVRELEHVIEHAFILCRRSVITSNDLPADFMAGSGLHDLLDEGSEEESRAILEALEKTGWNKASAARLLGMHRATLYRKMEKYKLVRATRSD